MTARRVDVDSAAQLVFNYCMLLRLLLLLLLLLLLCKTSETSRTETETEAAVAVDVAAGPTPATRVLYVAFVASVVVAVVSVDV